MPPSQRRVQGCAGCVVDPSLHVWHRPLRRPSWAPPLARLTTAIHAYWRIEPRPPFEPSAKSFGVHIALSHCDYLSVSMRRLCLSSGHRQRQALSLGLALDEPSAGPGKKKEFLFCSKKTKWRRNERRYL